MLPQHQTQPREPSASQDSRLRILALGTEWHSGHGGLSTFNRQLCRALAAAGVEVICVVLRASPEDKRDAESQQRRMRSTTMADSIPGSSLSMIASSSLVCSAGC